MIRAWALAVGRLLKGVPARSHEHLKAQNEGAFSLIAGVDLARENLSGAVLVLSLPGKGLLCVWCWLRPECGSKFMWGEEEPN